MKQPRKPAELDMEELARQLRKPEGPEGLEVAARMNEGNLLINEAAIGAVSLRRGAKILELGMGNGRFAPDILKRGDDATYVGLDYSADMVAAAGRENQDLVANGSVDFVLGNLRQMPFDAGTFDCVLTVNTLYFWDDPVAVLSEIGRVMHRSADLVIAVRPERVLRRFPVVQYGFETYSAGALHSLLEANGFHVTRSIESDEPSREIDGSVYAVANLVVTAKKRA